MVGPLQQETKYIKSMVYGLSQILFITTEDFPTQSVCILSAFDN